MKNIDFMKLALDMKEELINIRRDLHRHPELGYEEHRTSDIIKSFLKKEEIEFYETAKTGICAIIKGNGEKTVALRADIDGLPLEDKKSCEYSSIYKGRMHACGHDAHTAILLGCAKVLNSLKEELKGNVKLLFEPAEETTGGAKVMIEEGVLLNPKVDAVIGLHVEEKIETGKIGIKRGVVNAASNPFKIKVTGKGGHGARPSDSVDPIVLSANLITALQTVVSREIPPTDPAVISFGTINGGTAQNIIPEEVFLSGIIRTMKSEHREYVKHRLVEITEGIAKTYRGEAIVEIEESYPCLYNNDSMVDLLKNSASKIISKEFIYDLETPNMGVESFAYFSMERPSVFYYLGVRNEEKGIIHPAHSSLFDIDEEALSIGMAIQSRAAYDFLNIDFISY